MKKLPQWRKLQRAQIKARGDGEKRFAENYQKYRSGYKSVSTGKFYTPKQAKELKRGYVNRSLKSVFKQTGRKESERRAEILKREFNLSDFQARRIARKTIVNAKSELLKVGLAFTYKYIETGKHAGKFRNTRTGEIKTETNAKRSIAVRAYHNYVKILAAQRGLSLKQARDIYKLHKTEIETENLFYPRKA